MVGLDLTVLNVALPTLSADLQGQPMQEHRNQCSVAHLNEYLATRLVIESYVRRHLGAKDRVRLVKNRKRGGRSPVAIRTSSPVKTSSAPMRVKVRVATNGLMTASARM